MQPKLPEILSPQLVFVGSGGHAALWLHPGKDTRHMSLAVKRNADTSHFCHITRSLVMPHTYEYNC